VDADISGNDRRVYGDFFQNDSVLGEAAYSCGRALTLSLRLLFLVFMCLSSPPPKLVSTGDNEGKKIIMHTNI